MTEDYRSSRLVSAGTWEDAESHFKPAGDSVVQYPTDVGVEEGVQHRVKPGM